MTVLAWAIPLVVIVFGWTLNEFLRGRAKELIGGVLSLLIFVLIGVAFFVSGWTWGLGALIGSFMLGSLFRLPALALARRVIGFPDLGVEEYHRKRCEAAASTFRTAEYWEQAGRGNAEEAQHRSGSVSRALRDARVQAVLGRHGATEQDLEALYDRVEVVSLPPAHREQVVRNAQLVDFFLSNSPSGTINDRYVRNVRGGDVSMMLSLWASSNPNGGPPK